MKRYIPLLLQIAAICCLGSCASTYQGTLVDARNYLNLKAAGESPAQQYAAFYAMKANLPAAILMEKEKLVFLSHASGQLANYSSMEVKAKGAYLPKQRLLKAKQFWVKTEKGWEQVPIR